MENEVKKKLTLETFNDALITAGGMDEKGLLQAEIETAYAWKIQRMEDLVDLINKGKSKQKVMDQVRVINNIDHNLDSLMERLEAIEDEDQEE